MRISLLTASTRGDVQPAIALGVGLKKTGFDVQLAAFEEFRTLAEEYELDFFPLRESVQELKKPSLVDLVDSGSAVFRTVPELLKLFRELFLQMTADFWQASQVSDVLISIAATAMPAAAVAEKLDIPHIETSALSGLADACVSIHLLALACQHGKRGKKSACGSPEGVQFVHLCTNKLLAKLGLRPVIKRCRTEVLNLPARPPRQNKRAEKQIVPALAGFSEHVLPRPADWGANIHVTGYWFLDTLAYTPPPALKAFLVPHGR